MPSQSNYLLCWDDGLHWWGRVYVCLYFSKAVDTDGLERCSLNRQNCLDPPWVDCAIQQQSATSSSPEMVPGSALSLFTTWTVNSVQAGQKALVTSCPAGLFKKGGPGLKLHGEKMKGNGWHKLQQGNIYLFIRSCFLYYEGGQTV